MPIGVALNESCVWLESYLSTRSEFNDTAYTFMPSDIQRKLDICMFGNGSLLEEFDIQSKILQITQMFDNLDEALYKLNPDSSNPNSSNYIEANSSNLVINAEIQYIAGVRDGLFPDHSNLSSP